MVGGTEFGKWASPSLAAYVLNTHRHAVIAYPCRAERPKRPAGSGREIFVTVIECGRNLPFEMRFLVDSKTYIYRNTVHSEPCLIIDHGSGF